MATNESKTARILDSSLTAFCSYGFQKTSMQNIATAAGISRPALYLLFKNKEDVFRAGSIRTHELVMNEMRLCLAQPSPVYERIAAALRAFFEGLMREISESAHGAELFDVSLELVGDVVIGARRELHELIAGELQLAESRGEIDLARIEARSESVAALLIATVDGLKSQASAALSVEDGLALQIAALKAATAA